MSFIDTIISKIAPHDCLACGVERQLLCASCVNKLDAVPECCYRCGLPSPGCLTCPDCRLTTDLYAVKAAAAYSGTAKDLIWKLKSGGAQAAASVMASRMVLQLERRNNPLITSVFAATMRPGQGHKVLIVPVPTATSRVRARGYDQARLLARQLAHQTGLPYAGCLARLGQTHQVGAGRQQRLEQLGRSFYVKRHYLVKNAHIILVDDVITTGASLETAARVLKTAGAARVEALTFAQVVTKKQIDSEGTFDI